jgi:hypothetical protein
MPTELIDANTEAASSTASTEAAQDAVSREKSSNSQQDGKETADVQSLADVVKQAAASATSESSTEVQTEETETKSAESEEPAEETETAPEEGKKSEESKEPPFHEHPRWKEVVKERDTYKEEIAQLKPLAEQTKALHQFLQENEVPSEDAQQALVLAALMRKNPQEAVKHLRTILENTETVLGARLPADLQKRVDDGLIDAETAKEVARLRVERQTSEMQVKRSQGTAAEQATMAMAGAVTQWETSKATSDADWQRKYPMLQDRFSVLAAQRPPKTPAEAVALAETAYSEVTQRLTGFLPKPTQKKVLSSTGSSTKASAELQLDSLNDLGKLVRSVAARHK